MATSRAKQKLFPLRSSSKFTVVISALGRQLHCGANSCADRHELFAGRTRDRYESDLRPKAPARSCPPRCPQCRWVPPEPDRPGPSLLRTSLLRQRGVRVTALIGDTTSSPEVKKRKEGRKKGRGRESKRYFSSQHLRWDAHSSHCQQTAVPDPTGSATAGRGRRVTERGSQWHSLCCSIPGTGDLHR